MNFYKSGQFTCSAHSSPRVVLGIHGVACVVALTGDRMIVNDTTVGFSSRLKKGGAVLVLGVCRQMVSH